MIKRLRRRFVIMVMSIVTIILAAIFVAVLLFMNSSILSNTDVAMERVLSPQGEPQGSNFEHKKVPPGRDGMPVLLFERDQNGDYRLVRGDSFEFSEQELNSLVTAALESGETSGELRDYHMDFELRGNLLAFVSTVANDNVLESMLFICAAVFLGTLTLFFLLSILLSKWAVRPTEQAWQAQRRFVADASHELKTPLTIILSNADMELQSSDEPNAHTALIREEALRMKSLIEQMLNMARLDAVDTRLVTEIVNLSELIEGSLLPFEPILFENGVELVSEIRSPLFVKGDRERLRRMLECLLDNAVKYTPEGERVIVGLKENKKNAVLTVRNTGVTLSKEQTEHVFDRFYRAEDSRTSVGSFGLGLSIAQSIANKHKTEITIASDGELGVIFTVSFPLVQSSNGNL